MTINKKKRLLYLSHFLFILSFLVITLVAYFLVQSIREAVYQNRFENRFTFISLVEDGEVDPVQVFHGVKVNTFWQEEESEKKSRNIIFEVKDEPEAEINGFKLPSDPKGMADFAEAIQYKKMVENKSENESFIISMKLTPESEKPNSKTTKYRTYHINENGVIKESNFTIETKSKLETQWIRGFSGEQHGYYTDLPYQKGGTLSLISLAFLGLLFLLGGVGFRRGVIFTERGKAA